MIPENPSGDNYFPLHRASAILGISIGTLVELLRTKRIRKVETSEDQILISFEELERFRNHDRGNAWS